MAEKITPEQEMKEILESYLGGRITQYTAISGLSVFIGMKDAEKVLKRIQSIRAEVAPAMPAPESSGTYTGDILRYRKVVFPQLNPECKNHEVCRCSHKHA